VATVDHLEEGDLGVTRQVHILGAVGYELHKTTTCHFFLYPWWRKKICHEQTPDAASGKPPPTQSNLLVLLVLKQVEF
jgi:hypothetical protein